MEHEQEGDIPILVDKLRQSTAGGKATVAAIALLNAIPYAGGVIASIIGEVASQRRVNKIADALSARNAKLEQSGAEPTEHLTEDQIIEAVHSTLSEVAITSDKEKIAALKSGLGYVFLSSDTFERKQVFLAVLRSMTSVELAMFSAVYGSSDPYRVVLPDPEETYSTNDPFSRLNRPLRSGVAPQMVPLGTHEECGKPALGDFLAEQANVDRALGDAGLRLLDAKGLTAAGSRLSEKHCVVYGQRHWPTLHSTFSPSFAISITGELKPSPLEASRTEFGRQFKSFVHQY